MGRHKVKAIQFKRDDEMYAGQTRWLAAKVTATGRASHWCRHYHTTEAAAKECGRLLSGETQTVWVAIVPMKYEVMAVGTTAEQAVDLACRKALLHLRGYWKPEPVPADCNTAKKIAEYFGVWAQRIDVGSAVMYGG